MDLHHARIDCGEPGLQRRTAALSFDAVHRIGISAMFDELQSNGAARVIIAAEIYIGHAAARQLADNLEFSDLAVYRYHVRRLRCFGVPRMSLGCVRPSGSPFRKKLNLRIGPPSMPCGMMTA